MYFTNPRVIIAIVFAVLILAIGCSGGGASPVAPVESPDTPVVEREQSSERTLWGAWEIRFDPFEMSVEIEPARTVLAHFEITDFVLPPACDDCFSISVNGFDTVTRILDADVTLRNPTPIAGKDVRGILFTNQYGHVITNADGWTELWNIPNGDDINPFKAFAKGEANRIFTGGAEHSENYLIYIPQPPNYWAIQFAVDASWPGNCKEPYSIENFLQDGELYDVTSSMVELSIDVYDWQDDVTDVRIAQDEILGAEDVAFEHAGGGTWVCSLENELGAPAGEYTALIKATSPITGKHLYDRVSITITEEPIPGTLTDITPPWLNLRIFDACILGDYAYLACAEDGLHIWDVSDFSNPEWVNMVETGTFARSVAVADGYAYVGEHQELVIIDISTPGSEFIHDTIFESGYHPAIVIDNGYAYVSGYGCLAIYEISSPGSMQLVKTVDTLLGYGTPAKIVIQNDYAYLVTNWEHLVLIDINPPESAAVIGSLYLMGTTCGYPDMDVENGIACVTGKWAGMHIIDVDPPEEPHIINTIPGLVETGVGISNGYAYATDMFEGLVVIDIDPPESASVVATAILPGTAGSLKVSEDHIYIWEYFGGLHRYSIDSPTSPNLDGTVPIVSHCSNVAVSDNIAYVTNVLAGLAMVDLSIPSEAAIVKTVNTDWAAGIDKSGGYAYVADASYGLRIIDVHPLEASYIFNTIDVGDKAYDVDVSMGFAYVVTETMGLIIIDIEPQDTAGLVNSVPLVGGSLDVCVDGGYAYVTDVEAGLQVIDIDPPLSASIIKTVVTDDTAVAVSVSGDYAFVAAESAGLHIVDISVPASASIVKTVDTPGMARGVAVVGGYAYVADYSGGLQVIDIMPVDTASIITTLDSMGDIWDVAVSGDFAYVASYEGFRIIQLW